MINISTLNKIYFNGVEIEEMYFNRVKVWSKEPEPFGEVFSITINSGTDSSFIIPTMGQLNNTYNTYSWTVNWGDGVIQNWSGTGASGSGISHTYSVANTDYTILITPQSDTELGWLRAFGFFNITTGSGTTANKVKLKVVNSPLTEKMIRTAATNNYVCAYMFNGCTSLTMNAVFNLPQSITTVGNVFCVYMFNNCTSLTMNAVFNLPQSITTVGYSFCYLMFNNCTSLTMNAIFNLPQSITTVGSTGGFCAQMFNNCRSLTMNSVFNLPQSITTAWTNFFDQMFNGCTSLTMNAVFNLPQSITTVGNLFCYRMFYGCTSLTMNAVFNLPQSITTVGTSFCRQMFNNCTSLTTGVIKFFGLKILSYTELNKSYVFYQTFYGCTALSETISATTIPQLTISPSATNQCFRNANATAIATAPTNWK